MGKSVCSSSFNRHFQPMFIYHDFLSCFFLKLRKVNYLFDWNLIHSISSSLKMLSTRILSRSLDTIVDGESPRYFCGNENRSPPVSSVVKTQLFPRRVCVSELLPTKNSIPIQTYRHDPLNLSMRLLLVLLYPVERIRTRVSSINSVLLK